MADGTRVEWAEASWNPVVGCRAISQGCTRCYAARMAHRLDGLHRGYDGLTSHFEGRTCWTGSTSYMEERLSEPLRWRKPRRVFVCSMGDLFYEDVPVNEIAAVFDLMFRCTQHQFQVLTKRPARIAEFMAWRGLRGLPAHIWTGTTVENRAALGRIHLLRQVPTPIRWLSVEPLLEDLGTLNLTGISWVAVGCETGPGMRQCRPEWIGNVVEQCKAASVAVFVKKTRGVDGFGPVLKDPSDWPSSLRVRQYPEVRP